MVEGELIISSYFMKPRTQHTDSGDREIVIVSVLTGDVSRPGREQASGGGLVQPVQEARPTPCSSVKKRWIPTITTRAPGTGTSHSSSAGRTALPERALSYCATHRAVPWRLARTGA